MVYVDYNPDRGVTFRENRNSDVQIVGIGYNEDITLDSKSLNGINRKAIDKRRHTKGKKACSIIHFTWEFAAAHPSTVLHGHSLRKEYCGKTGVPSDTIITIILSFCN